MWNVFTWIDEKQVCKAKGCEWVCDQDMDYKDDYDQNTEDTNYYVIKNDYARNDPDVSYSDEYH